MTIHEYHKKMREYFDIHIPGKYLDEVFLLSRQIRIDLSKFDIWLHDRIGQYEKSNMSIRQAITKHYGIDACKFMEKLL
jgi:hypothetical protein